MAALAHVQLARRPCTRVLALSHRPRRRAADQRGGGRYGRAARGREWGTASAATDCGRSPAAATDCGRSPAAAAADQHDCAAAAATAAATTASATTSATAATSAGATTGLRS